MPLPEPNDIEEAARLFRAAAKMAELKGFSVEDLAIELKVSRRTILNWTHGQTHVPVSALLRTCRLAGVKLDRLYHLMADDDDNWASVVGDSRRPRLRVVTGWLALGAALLVPLMAASTRSLSPAEWWSNAQYAVHRAAAPSTETAHVPTGVVSDSPQPAATMAAMPAPVPMPVPSPERKPRPTPVPTPEPSASPVPVLNVVVAPSPTPSAPPAAVPASASPQPSPAPRACLIVCL